MLSWYNFIDCNLKIMTKLNQIIAVLNTVKADQRKKVSAVYQLVQKSSLFQGVTRVYSPREEDGFVYPAENQPVQMRAQQAISEFIASCTELYDLALTQDAANQMAVGNIRIGSQPIATSVPVSTLLFLEKQIVDLRTFVESLPVLPIDQQWTYNSNKGCFVADPKATTKTKKITDFVVAYEATEHHPAQIKEVSKDVVEGTWETTALSGALPQDEKNAILHRVNLLHQAIVKAREEANSIEVDQKSIASDLFGYVFGTMSGSTN